MSGNRARVWPMVAERNQRKAIAGHPPPGPAPNAQNPHSQDVLSSREGQGDGEGGGGGGGSGAKDAEERMMQQQREEYGRRGIHLTYFEKGTSIPHFINLDEDPFRSHRFMYLLDKVPIACHNGCCAPPTSPTSRNATAVPSGRTGLGRRLTSTPCSVASVVSCPHVRPLLQYHTIAQAPSAPLEHCQLAEKNSLLPLLSRYWSSGGTLVDGVTSVPLAPMYKCGLHAPRARPPPPLEKAATHHVRFGWRHQASFADGGEGALRRAQGRGRGRGCCATGRRGGGGGGREGLVPGNVRS